MSDAGAYDDQSLPWLEGVEDVDGQGGPSARKMLVAFLLVLIGAAAVAAATFWVGRRDAQVSGAPQLIKAEPGPYKVKPENPGGLDVAGDSETAYSTSAGQDPDAQLDVSKLPGGAPPPLPDATTEKPPAKLEKPPAKPEPKHLPSNETKEPAPDEGAAPAAVHGGPAIQIGAYGSTIKADTAWSMLSSRFPEVKALKKVVVTVKVDGKTFYRLRAAGSAEETRAACAALKAGGENCLPVN